MRTRRSHPLALSMWVRRYQKEKLLGTHREETMRRVERVRAEGAMDADCSARTTGGKRSIMRKEQGMEAEQIFSVVASALMVL